VKKASVYLQARNTVSVATSARHLGLQAAVTIMFDNDSVEQNSNSDSEQQLADDAT